LPASILPEYPNALEVPWFDLIRPKGNAILGKGDFGSTGRNLKEKGNTE
jgi:hypothetical protein